LRYVRMGSRSRAKMMVTELRSFFRFLQLRGEIDAGFAACFPIVPNWRLTILQESVSGGEVRPILSTCDRRTSKQGQA
jgi:hypothetical protein